MPLAEEQGEEVEEVILHKPRPQNSADHAQSEQEPPCGGHCPAAQLTLTLSRTSRKASWSHNRSTLEAQPEDAGRVEGRWG